MLNNLSVNNNSLSLVSKILKSPKLYGMTVESVEGGGKDY